MAISKHTRMTSTNRKRPKSTFKNDLRELRSLGVEIEYHRSDQEYRLVSYGDFSPVDLNPIDLHTLAFLIETFEPGTPNHDAVRQLLERISSWLPPEPRASLAMRRQHVRIDLQRRDSDHIDPQVRRQLEEAIGKRVVRFQYMAPGQDDGIPRTHTVQPWRLYFDTWRGHYYLDGYWLEVSGPYGRLKQEKWQQFRLGPILPETFEVLPDRLPPEEPRRKRWPLAYKLAPHIARDGRVTAHFENTQIHEPDEDGWVPVTATTTNLFRARQILLSYGAGCVVTGGSGNSG